MTLAILTGFSWFSALHQSKCWDGILIKPQLLPSKSYVIYYSPITLSFGAIQFDIWTVLHKIKHKNKILTLLLH
jgi:hypothetical protein